MAYILASWTSLVKDVTDYTRGLIATSVDGKNFDLISGQTGFVGANGYLRDTSIVRTNTGVWGAVGTCGNSWPSPGFCLFIANSPNGLATATSTQIAVANGNNGVNAAVDNTWAPEFYTANQGCFSASGTDAYGIPCSGAESYYVYFSASNNQDGGPILAIKFTDSSLTTWTDLSGTSGVATLVFNGFGVGDHTYDPNIVKFYNPGTSTATYVMFVVYNTSTSTQHNIQYTTSSSLAGPFALASTGDWSHQMNEHDGPTPTIIGNTHEGGCFVRTGTTSGRLYFDKLDNAVYPAGFSYIEANNIDYTDPASLSTATWSNPVSIGGPGPSGSIGDHWRHGTVIPVFGETAKAVLALSRGSRNQEIESVNSVFGTPLTVPALNTASNCVSSASPAVCASSPTGSFVVAVSATTVTINTTAVTANSNILIIPDSSLGTRLGVTCNTTALTAIPEVSARVPGTSFTVKTNAPATNPKCFSYFLSN